MNQGGLFCFNAFSSLSSSIIKINTEVSRLIYPSNSCNNPQIKTLTLENYPYLKELVIGDECFGYVNTVKIKDDVSLESIMIGKNSFTLNKNSYGENTGRSFTLTNCHNLHSVTIGRFSFSDYNSCNLSCMNEEIKRVMYRLV